jgi:hypothetical protein
MIHEAIKLISMFFVIAGFCLIVSPGEDMPIMKKINEWGNFFLKLGLFGIIVSFIAFWLSQYYP